MQQAKSTQDLTTLLGRLLREHPDIAVQLLLKYIPEELLHQFLLELFFPTPKNNSLLAPHSACSGCGACGGGRGGSSWMAPPLLHTCGNCHKANVPDSPQVTGRMNLGKKVCCDGCRQKNAAKTWHVCGNRHCRNSVQMTPVLESRLSKGQPVFCDGCLHGHKAKKEAAKRH